MFYGFSESIEEIQETFDEVSNKLVQEAGLLQMFYLDNPTQLAFRTGTEVFTEVQMVDFQYWLLFNPNGSAHRYKLLSFFDRVV